MKRSIALVIIYLISTVVTAENNSFKESTLNDYNNRCNEVLQKKGYSDSIRTKECDCEVNVINNNFTTFNLMIMGAKKLAGKEVLKKESIAEIKEKLNRCKAKYL